MFGFRAGSHRPAFTLRSVPRRGLLRAEEKNSEALAGRLFVRARHARQLQHEIRPIGERWRLESRRRVAAQHARRPRPAPPAPSACSPPARAAATRRGRPPASVASPHRRLSPRARSSSVGPGGPAWMRRFSQPCTVREPTAQPNQRSSRAATTCESDAAMYTSMSGMPVLRYAVDTSPQGMVMARTGPRPKSMMRVRQAVGTRVSTPPRRIMPPARQVFHHRRGRAAREAADRLKAEGELASPSAAVASGAPPDSRTGPRRSRRPAAASRRPPSPPASRAASSSKTDISPVMSR